MASRRARIKVAPNLSSVRSKGRTEDKCKDHVPKQTVDNNKNIADTEFNKSVAHSVEETVPKNLVMNGIHSNRPSVENNNAKKIVDTKIVPEPENPTEIVETKPTEIINLETKSPETPKTVESKASEPAPLSVTKSSWQEPNPGGATGKFVDGRYIPTEAVERQTEPEAPAALETKTAEAKSATIRRFLGRPKFKPNLAPRSRPDELPRRTRKFSSGDKTEQRKRNNSTGNTSEGEGNNETVPARIRRISSSENVDTLGRTRKLSTGDKVETTGRRRLRSESNSSDDEGRRMVRVNGQPMMLQPRTRRLTDTLYTCDQKINPGLKRRKVESKRRFSNGVPGRGKMTMFDLIYYNPENGTEMLVDEDDLPQKVGEVVEQAVDAPATPPPAPQEDEEEDAVPVPQVKVGINGEIILDESSTMLETTAAKKAKTDLTNSPIVVENASKFTNYGTWSKKKRYSDWSERETFKFYEALSIVGSDFSMMASLFKKRTRAELKLKFKKEERINNTLVDKCLKQKGSFTDIDRFMEEESEDDVIEEEVVKETRGRKRKSKGPTSRRRISTRGLYASSSGGEEADVSETSRSPARKRVTGRKVADRSAQNGKSPAAVHPRKEPPPSNTPAGIRQLEAAKRAPIPPIESVPSTESSLQKLPGVRFPPALLAANPGLAGAKPGSLVVVASPSKTDPSAQLLHVYMVSEKKKKLASSQSISQSSNSPVRAVTVEMPRTEPGRRNNDPGRLSIDPAVVRAVDRKRTSVERNQRLQERSPELNTSNDNTTYRRQRTLSEGNLVSPTRLRTLSGSQRSSNWLEVESEEGHYLRTRVSTNLGSPSSSDSIPESSSQPLGTSSEPPATSTEEASTVETLNLPTLPIARKSKPVLQ